MLVKKSIFKSGEGNDARHIFKDIKKWNCHLRKKSILRTAKYKTTEKGCVKSGQNVKKKANKKA